MTTVAEFLRGGAGGPNLLYPTMSSTQTYNYQERVVQFDDDPNSVVSAEASVIFSCPPVLSSALATGRLQEMMMPIGSVQGFSDNETPNMQEVPEVGSRLKRMAFAMARYQVQMSKVLTWHSNLRHALYAWVARLDGGFSKQLEFIRKPGEDSAPGRSHFTTSESDLQRVPFGIAVFKVTAGGILVSREFFEKCYIANIGSALQAGQAIVQENVSIYVTRKVPLNNIQLAMNPNFAPFDITLGNGDPLLNP